MGVPNCPHCGVELPVSGSTDPATAEPPASFCPSCGRRVEGWKPGFRAALGGAAVGGPLPGSEEPTKAIATSPSLLRAAAAGAPASEPAPSATPPAPEGPSSAAGRTVAGETDSVLMQQVQTNRTPLVVVGLLCVGGAVGLFALRRQSAPVPETPPAATPAPSPVAVPPTPPPTAQKGKPRRISAPPIAPGTAPVGKKAPPATIAVGEPNPSGPAKNRQQATGDRQPATGNGQAAPGGKDTAPGGTTASAPGPLPTAVNETVEGEATPLTEEERRAEAAARADADGVRFVVRAHLPQVHACYSRVFKEQSPGGRVEIGFIVNASGKATKIRTEGNSTGSDGLAKCLEQRIAEWDFPRPSGGEFELIYPFVFSAGS